jgi:hypothetical protein
MGSMNRREFRSSNMRMTLKDANCAKTQIGAQAPIWKMLES